MDQRTLGTDGLVVSAIGLGCMSMTGGYSDKPDRQEMRLHRLEENIGAAEVHLSAGELAEIEAAAATIQVQGGRYNEAAEQMTNL